MSSDPRVTEAEQRILDAGGALVDLREGQPSADNPVGGRSWGPERTVRAAFLADLISQATGPGAGRGVRAVRLRGARITGAIDLENQDLSCPLTLQDCSIDEPVSVRQARAVEICLPGCHLPSLDAAQLEVRRNLLLDDGLTATSVDLRGAHVGGVLSLDGAILDNPHGVTLSGGALTVDQGMSCGSGFTSTGSIGLYGARISHGLSFTGAALANATGWALDAQGMQVGDSLFLGSSYHMPEGFSADGGLRLVSVRVDGFVCCWGAHIKGRAMPEGTGYAIAGWGLTVSSNLMLNEGFTADGEVSITNARVGDEIELQGAVLTNPGGRALSADGVVTGGSVLCTDGFTARGAVSLAGAKIAGSLDFTSAVLDEPAGNTVNLRAVTAATLTTRAAAPPDQIDLRHASVVVLDDDPAAWPARSLLRDFTYDTIEHQPAVTTAARLGWIARDAEGYLPQPYEQLIAAYRRAGQEQSARTVAIAKQRRRRQVLSPAARIWNWLLYLTIGYGYRTWQAGLWLLALWMTGAAVFAHAYPASMSATTRHPMPFNAPVYALDVLLPIISLGEQDSWQPRGPALYAYWTLIILGWALTSALVAGLAGIIKHD